MASVLKYSIYEFFVGFVHYDFSQSCHILIILFNLVERYYRKPLLYDVVVLQQTGITELMC